MPSLYGFTWSFDGRTSFNSFPKEEQFFNIWPPCCCATLESPRCKPLTISWRKHQTPRWPCIPLYLYPLAWWGKREGPRGIDIFEETRDQFPTTVQLVNAKIPIHWVTYSWQSHPCADAVCPPTAPLPLRDTGHVKSSERLHRRLGPHLSIKILTEGKARQVNFPWVVNPTPLPPQELKFDRHNNPGNRDNWNFKGKTLGTKVGFQTLSQFHFFSVIVQCSCPIRSVMDYKIKLVFPMKTGSSKNVAYCLTTGIVCLDQL